MKELLEELKFQLGELHLERIDKDDFINAIEEIYWEFKENDKPLFIRK
jgi:hypothetical protein